MRLTLTPFTLHPKVLVSGSRGALPERRGVRLSILRGTESMGEGEVTPMPEHGTEHLDDALKGLNAFTFSSVPETLEAIDAALASLDATPAARHGVEIALLDGLARRRGISVAELIAGAPTRRTVPVNAIVDGADSQALVARALEAVAAGFTTLKLKVGARAMSADAQRLLAVRQAVGPSVKLRIDANGAWTEGAARSALRGMKALNLELCEQPIAPHDAQGLRRLRGIACPIAADEALLEVAGPTTVLDMEDRGPAADVLVLKPMALGGVMRALTLARQAHGLGLGAYVTTMFDGPVARAAAAQLAAAIPQQSQAHGLATVELFEGATVDAYTPVRGAIALPNVPGLGL